MSNIFEQASRNKIRFTYQGQLSVEDLWDLPAKTANNEFVVPGLDAIYAELMRQSEVANTNSLSSKKTTANELLTLKLELVKYVFQTRLAEWEEKRNEAQVKAHNDKIKLLIAKKQEDQLGNLTLEELQAMLK